MKVNTNHNRAFTVLLERVRQKIEKQGKEAVGEGHRGVGSNLSAKNWQFEWAAGG